MSGTVGLGDPDLLAAVAQLRPIVFLDTAVRFMNGKEENSASDMSVLVESLFNLLRLGAKAVVAVHHSPKSSAESETPTLENTLRGSGDLGASADCVYSVRCTDQELFRVKVSNVKMRDAEPIRQFVIQGHPFLSDNGAFAMLSGPSETLEAAKIKKLVAAIQANPKAGYRELAGISGIGKSCINQMAAKAGWTKARGLVDCPRGQGWTVGGRTDVKPTVRCPHPLGGGPGPQRQGSMGVRVRLNVGAKKSRWDCECNRDVTPTIELS